MSCEIINSVLFSLLIASWVFIFLYFTFDFWRARYLIITGKFKGAQLTPIDEATKTVLQNIPVVSYGDNVSCLLEMPIELEFEGRKLKRHMWLTSTESITNADKTIASNVDGFVWCDRFKAATRFKSRQACLQFIDIYKLQSKNVFIRPLAIPITSGHVG